jgi:hypothetical protein
MRQADPLDASDALEDIGWGGSIIVTRALDRAGRQNAGVERAADDNPDVPLFAERQETFERVLLQERIAASEQEAVEIASFQKCLANLPLIEARADRPDRSRLRIFIAR